MFSPVTDTQDRCFVNKATGDLSPVKKKLRAVFACVCACVKQRKCLGIQFFLFHRNENRGLQLNWSAIETTKDTKNH